MVSGQKKQDSQCHAMVVGVTALQILITANLETQNRSHGSAKWVTYGCRKKYLGQIAIVSCLDHKISLPLSNLIFQGHTFVLLSKVTECMVLGIDAYTGVSSTFHLILGRAENLLSVQ